MTDAHKPLPELVGEEVLYDADAEASFEVYTRESVDNYKKAIAQRLKELKQILREANMNPPILNQTIKEIEGEQK